MLILSLILPALADDGSNLVPPVLNAQRFRPSIDADRSLWTDDSTVGESGRFSARGLVSYTSRPLVFAYADGDVVDIVGGVLQLDAAAGYTVGPVRLGLEVPVYLRTFGGIAEDTTGLGDLALDVKAELLDREDKGVGIALDGRLALPTAQAESLASNDFTAELSAIVDADVGDLRLAGNVGAYFVPQNELVNTDYGSQFLFRLSGGYALSESSGVALDLNGNTTFNDRDPDAAFPVEVLAGGWHRLGGGDVVLRGGVGTGLTPGIGSPDFRLVVGVGFEPAANRDTDGDGIWDKDDKCVNDPEDMDGVDDTDGCNDPTRVKLTFIDKETKQPVPSVTSGIAGREAAGAREVDLKPDSYALQASAPGYKTTKTMVEVGPGKPVEKVIVLEKEILQGRLIVKVVDEKGVPVDATLTIPGVTLDRPTNSLDRMVNAGDVVVSAKAPDYAAAPQKVVVKQGDTTTVTITMQKEKAVFKADGTFELKESVFFETGKAIIKPESFQLLDQVASLLQEHPEAKLVRIEGHTDSRGSASANLDLSTRRAAAVRQYLIDKGVDGARLQSQGFGESKPLVNEENEAAWSKNRRVDFIVDKVASPAK